MLGTKARGARLDRFPPLAAPHHPAPHALFVPQLVEDPRHVLDGQTGGFGKERGFRGSPRRLEGEQHEPFRGRGSHRTTHASNAHAGTPVPVPPPANRREEMGSTLLGDHDEAITMSRRRTPVQSLYRRTPRAMPLGHASIAAGTKRTGLALACPCAWPRALTPIRTWTAATKPMTHSTCRFESFPNPIAADIESAPRIVRAAAGTSWRRSSPDTTLR